MNDQPLEFKDQSHRLYTAPFFGQRDADDIIVPIIRELVAQIVPEMVGPIVSAEVEQAVRELAVMRAGDTMMGRLYLNHALPIQDSEVASKLYVDMKVAGSEAGIPEPTTAGNFLRTNTATWVQGLPLSGGTVTGSLTVTSTIFTSSLWSQAGLIGLGPRLAIGGPSGAAAPAGSVNVAAGYYVDGVSIGTPPFLSAAGVTNGSEAATGMVGEVISAAGLAAAVPIGTWTTSTVATINLTAGDWMVTAEIVGLNTSEGDAFVLIFSTSASAGWNSFGTDYHGVGTGLVDGNVLISMTPLRYNLTVPTTYYLRIASDAWGDPMDVSYFISARRMR